MVKLPTTMASKRINVSIHEELHQRAVEHAKKAHYTDLSGLITKLLVADMSATRPLAQILDQATARVQKAKKARSGSNRGS